MRNRDKTLLLFQILGVIMLLEMVVMSLLRLLPPDVPHWIVSLLDTAVLGIFCAPVFHFWIFRAESRAERGESILRGVVDNVGVGISVISPELRILSLNRQMRDWFPNVDASAKPICYRSYNSPPRSEPCSYCPTVLALRDGTVHEAVTDTPSPQGIVHYRVVASPIKDAEGRVAAVVELVEDISQQRRHEESLRQAYEGQRVLNEMLRISLAPGVLEEKLQLLLDRMFGTDWMRVMPKGAVFLRDGGELVLAAQRGLAGPLLKSCGRVALGRCLCGRAAQQGELVVASHVDERHEVSYEGMAPHGHICAPISAKGSVLGVLNLYLADGVVPEARQLEAVKAYADLIANMLLLHKAEEQLQQSLKMEAVGRLAGGVAHDFNNMLTAIKGYAEFLAESLGGAGQQQQKDDALEIIKAADRAAALTGQLLAFSRRQVLDPVILDLDEVVLGVGKMLKRLLGEDVGLVCAPAGSLRPVRVDRGRLEQVVMNLCINSRDAMPRGGTLTIRTRNCELGAERLGELSDLPPGPYVELSVADTGEGMTPEVRSHIFEPFFTTKEKGKGTGLGLSMVYGIIKQSGGGIAVESSAGKGSTFRILLPVFETEGAEDGEPAARPDAPGKGSETILLVEDDAPVLALARRALEQRGYTVLAAEAGAAALGLLDGHGGEVQLLLTDVVMSGMNGRELSDRVRALRPGIKTLFISGYTNDVIARHGILEPGVELLPKPFTSEELARRVRRTLDS